MGRPHPLRSATLPLRCAGTAPRAAAITACSTSGSSRCARAFSGWSIGQGGDDWRAARVLLVAWCDCSHTDPVFRPSAESSSMQHVVNRLSLLGSMQNPWQSAGRGSMRSQTESAREGHECYPLVVARLAADDRHPHGPPSLTQRPAGCAAMGRRQAIWCLGRSESRRLGRLQQLGIRT